MTERIVKGTPASVPTMVKAALPVLPGVNLVPGVAKKGGPLPDLVLRREDVTIDPAHVAAYAEVCGFAPGQTLPLTYPHLLAFPLQLALMTDGSFPYPAIGTVHLRNRIAQHRPIGPSERLDVRVSAADLRPHPKGKVFDLRTSITSGEELVWESSSTYLRRGRGQEDATEGETFEVVEPTGAQWSLPGNLGRRYAAVSGDHNPIHLYPLTARALGFKRQIAHGMWSKARCVAALAGRIPDDAVVEVEFKKPIFLPGRVTYGSHVVDGGIDFALTAPSSARNAGAPHLVGRLRSAGPR